MSARVVVAVLLLRVTRAAVAGVPVSVDEVFYKQHRPQRSVVVCVLSLVSNNCIDTSHLTEYVIPANTNYISASYNKRPRNKIQL